MTTKKKDIIKKVDWRVLCIGLLCLTTIELYALSKGINGTLMTFVIAMIGLAIGVALPNPMQRNAK